jgi:hypothetical protein
MKHLTRFNFLHYSLCPSLFLLMLMNNEFFMFVLVIFQTIIV